MSVEHEKLLRPDQSLEPIPVAQEIDEEEGADTADRQSRLWNGMEGGDGGEKKKKKDKEATGPTKDEKEETERLDGTLWAKDENGKDLPPSLDDIAQGGLADCYVFAAMAAIVHSDPKRIKSMIKDNGNGTYTVTFKGTSLFSSDNETVTVDFVKGKRGALTDRNALWPLLIEKAYAQQQGGIDKLDHGGNAGDVVEDFMDMDAKRFDPRAKKADWILGKLAKAQKGKKPTTVLSPKKDEASKEKLEMSDTIENLHFWHFYAVVDVDEKARKVKLFNPWGVEHPNGDGWLDIEVIRTFFKEVDINE